MGQQVLDRSPCTRVTTRVDWKHTTPPSTSSTSQSSSTSHHRPSFIITIIIMTSIRIIANTKRKLNFGPGARSRCENSGSEPHVIIEKGVLGPGANNTCGKSGSEPQVFRCFEFSSFRFFVLSRFQFLKLSGCRVFVALSRVVTVATSICL